MPSIIDLLMQFGQASPMFGGQAGMAQTPPATGKDQSRLYPPMGQTAQPLSIFSPPSMPGGKFGNFIPTMGDNTFEGPPPMPPMPNTNAPPPPPQMPPPDMMAYAPPQGGQQPPMPGAQPPAPPMQAPPQQAPQQPQQGGFKGFMSGPKGDALMGLLAGWAQGGTWQDSLGKGGMGAVQGLKQGKRNKTVELFLANSNLDPATKALLADDPELARAYIQSSLAGKDDPAAVAEFKFAQKDGFKGGYLDFLKAKGEASGGGTFGKQPIFGTNADGQTVMGVIGPNGQFVESPAPPGVTYMGPGGSAEAKAYGTKVGEAKANIGTVENAGNRLVSAIDAALNDPSLPSITGPIQGRTYNVTGGANRAQSRLDQIFGATFLQAYNDLRGGGQITEAEGAKAESAYSRLRTQSMNDEDYRQALIEFKTEVEKLIGIAKQRAGQGGQPAQSSDGWNDIGDGVRIRELP